MPNLRLAAWFIALFPLAIPQPASAQDAGVPAAEMAIEQHVYDSCVKDAKLGAPGGELEGNCRCEAKVTLSVLTDAALKAMQDGTYGPNFQGPMFKVDQDGYSRAVIKSCPGVRPILQRQICDPNPTGAACVKLQKALQATQ